MAAPPAPPNQIAEKWGARFQASVDQIKQGVERVNVAPGQQAAAKADLWLQNTIAAKDKWARNVSAVSLQSWKNSMLTYGIQNLAKGVAKGKAKYAIFQQRWQQYYNSAIAPGLASMPRGSLEQNIARAEYVMRQAAQFKSDPLGGIIGGSGLYPNF